MCPHAQCYLIANWVGPVSIIKWWMRTHWMFCVVNKASYLKIQLWIWVVHLQFLSCLFPFVFFLFHDSKFRSWSIFAEDSSSQFIFFFVNREQFMKCSLVLRALCLWLVFLLPLLGLRTFGTLSLRWVFLNLLTILSKPFTAMSVSTRITFTTNLVLLTVISVNLILSPK